MNKPTKIGIGIVVAGVITLGAPVVPQDMQWVVSYETVAFDTSDGDLGMNEYARTGGFDRNGDELFYIREVPKNVGQFTFATSSAISGKKEITVSCEKCAYYSEFLGSKGKIKRVPFAGKYDDLRTLKNAPQPKKQEFVNVLSGNNTEAAIAFDATSNSGEKSGVSSFTWSHTTSGSDTLLFIGVIMDDNNVNHMDVSSATYNSVSMTSIRRDVQTAYNDSATEILYLKAPTAGANTVAVTLVGSNFGAKGGAITLTGVDQTTPLDANNGANGNSASASVAVTTVADNAWVLDTVGGWSPFTVGAGQTQRWNIIGTYTDGAGSTEGPKTPAGSVTMSWTLPSEAWSISAASFAPAISATPTPTPAQSVIWFD